MDANSLLNSVGERPADSGGRRLGSAAGVVRRGRAARRGAARPARAWASGPSATWSATRTRSLITDRGLPHRRHHRCRSTSRPPRAYFAAVHDVVDHVAVAERGRAAGVALGDDPVGFVEELVRRVRRWSPGHRPRHGSGARSAPSLLAEYVVTRTFELTVHTCDLLRALDRPAEPPKDAARSALRLLADLTAQGGRSAELLLALTGRTALAGRVQRLVRTQQDGRASGETHRRQQGRRSLAAPRCRGRPARSRAAAARPGCRSPPRRVPGCAASDRQQQGADQIAESEQGEGHRPPDLILTGVERRGERCGVTALGHGQRARLPSQDAGVAHVPGDHQRAAGQHQPTGRGRAGIRRAPRGPAASSPACRRSRRPGPVRVAGASSRVSARCPRCHRHGSPRYAVLATTNPHGASTMASAQPIRRIPLVGGRAAPARGRHGRGSGTHQSRPAQSGEDQGEPTTVSLIEDACETIGTRGTPVKKKAGAAVSAERAVRPPGRGLRRYARPRPRGARTRLTPQAPNRSGRSTSAGSHHR